ncbi:MAG: SDR family NAD(P)-dependent oxidoreductase [Pseudorhodobacter sp.]|nr:SDR family NAD(P)-dependent oxidoreductase [Pseudorhodobacter sp.]
MTFQGKRYWLVGASEGLGLALAVRMRAAGAHLILSGRSAETLAEAAKSIDGAMIVPMDVANDASVRHAAAEIGPIDGVVFLAGVYWPMSAKNVDAANLTAMCNINFTGCARVIAAVLPAMVERDRGHIVITGSLSGFRGLPGSLGYSAAKAGTMALAECLYADLRGTGVTVQLANPGFIRTRLTAKNDFAMPFLMEPDQAAAAMFDHMTTSRFKVSFPTLFSWVFRLSQFLPDWAYYRIFAPISSRKP